MPADRQSSCDREDELNAEESRIRTAYQKRQPNADKWLYSHFNKASLFTGQDLEQQMLASLDRYGRRALDAQRILEIGCGTGSWLREFIRWGAQPENLVGVDLLPDHIATAKRICPSAVTLICASAAKLGFPDGAFDLVLQATVFTSILDAKMKQQIASEILRVLKADGLVLWYDFLVNNPRNPDVRAVKRKEISQLFPQCRIELRRITLAPPIARRVAPYSWTASHLLGRIPFLCTHYLGVIQKG